MIRLLFIAALVALAQDATPPRDVVEFLRDVGSDLANAHPDPVNEPYVNARPFLDHFDSAMPGYAELSRDVEELTARAEIAATIDVLSDSGDAKKREMQLDWVMEIRDKTMQQARPARRALIKCTIEKKGRTWKFAAFQPVDFFKY